MPINGNLNFVTYGTAKTYEHMDSGFQFRVVGNGTLENSVTDKFSTTDNIAEGMNDRRLRQFVQAEGAFAKKENAVASEQVGQANLQELVTKTMGDGWKADAFYQAGGGVAGRTVVKYQSATGASQTVDIEHRGGEYKVSLTADVFHNGWQVKQSIEAVIENAIPVADKAIETAYFTKF